MIIPFKKEHLEVMDMREHEKNLLLGIKDGSIFERSISVTGYVDGRIIACGGIVPLGVGNADIWLIPSIYINKYPHIVGRQVKRWLEEIREELALNRMQTACLRDDLHTNWMQFLGFVNETPEGMKKYCNGVDYNMWGRTWE